MPCNFRATSASGVEPVPTTQGSPDAAPEVPFLRAFCIDSQFANAKGPLGSAGPFSTSAYLGAKSPSCGGFGSLLSLSDNMPR